MTVDLTAEIHAAWRESFQQLNRDRQGIRGLLDVSHAWTVAANFLKPRNLEGLSWNESDNRSILPAFHLVREAGMSVELLRHFYNDVESHFHLVERDVSRALRRIDESNRISAVSQVGAIMSDLLDRLVAWQQAWAAPLAAFEDPSLRPLFQQTFIQHLHLSLPSAFQLHIRAYFYTTFDSYHTLLERIPSTPAESPQARTSSLPEAGPSPHLHRLGMLSRFGPEMMALAYRKIEEMVEERGKGSWEESGVLDGLRRWGRQVVGGWWEAFYSGHGNAEVIMKPIYSRLDYHVCRTMTELRTTELFDIIVSFPDTMPALLDLKECLVKVDSRSDLVKAMKASNIKRLLHPGADTKDIITQYISTIRCLRIVDPPGVLLQKVADPIRTFLKKRPDTIRCIVAALVNSDEDGLDLTAGLGPDEKDEEDGEIKPLQTRDEREEDYSDPHWTPEPIDAAPDFRSGKASDIISTLVSIYDTRDSIVKELQVLLAQRLLSVKDYDLEREIRTVEILKLRFGEAALQVCEVMLKDLADSKRIDMHVHAELTTNLHPKIISRLFWPSFSSSALTLPGHLARMQARYSKAYHKFKPDKRLRWLPHLGTVDVRLELEDRTVECEASVLQASVIELFGSRGIPMSLDDLAAVLSVSTHLIEQSGINFWVQKGVLKADRKSGTWEVLERDEDVPGGGGAALGEVVDESSGMKTAEEESLERMRVFWQGMLTSHGSMELDRIHAFLGYAEGYDRTPSQLGIFLDALRREGAVDKRPDGSWALR